MDAEDAKQQALALADQVVAHFRTGDAPQATQLLEAALGHIRQLTDRAWECDLLGRFGQAALAAGQGPQALDLFQREHALAVAIQDLPAQSAAQRHLAHAAAGLNDPSAALEHARLGAALAGELGDAKDEADLRWLAAVLHADRRQRDLAIAQGRAAVLAMEKFNHPETHWFTDQLGHYAAHADTTALGQGPEPTGFHTPETTGHVTPESAGSRAGPLGMALSATRAAAQLLASGLKTASPEVQAQRLQACSGCVHHTGQRCRLCGCFTGLKARFPRERCPLGKWPV